MKNIIFGTAQSQAQHHFVLKSGVAVLAAAGLLSAFPAFSQEAPAADSGNVVVVTGMRSDENSYSFVFKQPATEEEKNLCEEALTCCPVEAIGNDG